MSLTTATASVSTIRVSVDLPDVEGSRYGVATPYDLEGVAMAIEAMDGVIGVPFTPGGANGAYVVDLHGDLIENPRYRAHLMADIERIVQDGIDNDRRIRSCMECETLVVKGDGEWIHKATGDAPCVGDDLPPGAVAYPWSTWLREDGTVGQD